MTNSIRKPKPLHQGDLVALVSPSGPIPSVSLLDDCRAVIEAMGYRVTVGPNAGNRFDYLAGTDEERAADLNAAIRNPEVRGIVCTRGGYGSGRLLPAINFEALAKDPKIFAGFSDLTAVHSGIHTRAGLASLHAPTVITAFVHEKQKIVPQGVDVFRHMVSSAKPLGSVAKAMKWTDPWTLCGGRARGQLIGGNLSVFASLLGTPYMPDPRGKILFLEDVGEEPYQLDRFFTMLELAGWFDKVEGIVLGQFTDAEPTADGRWTIDKVLPRIFAKTRKPILGNFPVGHVPFNASLPIGCMAELDATAGDLELTEAFCAE